MQTLRNLALGICVLCTVGGVIQIFWPDNSYKPVINTVLVLYIITSAVQIPASGHWQLPHLDLTESDIGSDMTDYQQYVLALSGEASAQALQDLLKEQGVEAQVSISDGSCRVLLEDAGDSGLAEQILRSNCGEMPYEILTGGDAS